MNYLRRFLFPFSVLYNIVTKLRNFCYNYGIKKSTSFKIPIIAVGNLSVGGTGKTPMIEYLVGLTALKKQAILSRGYKRKTKGFILGSSTSTVQDLGDEPYQYNQKFNNCKVAVCEQRVLGVQELIKQFDDLEIVLLDDAFQHRKIKASFYILLTSYNELFTRDFLLPTGNLRESSSGANRADVIVITKCPEKLSPQKKYEIEQELLKYKKPIFFSKIIYGKYLINSEKETLSLTECKGKIIALAGIAKPEYFYNYLNISKINQLTFTDHYNFSDNDIKQIIKKANGKIIITTEKDFMRLKHKINPKQLYYLPIKQHIIGHEKEFNQIITNHINTHI